MWSAGDESHDPPVKRVDAQRSGLSCQYLTSHVFCFGHGDIAQLLGERIVVLHGPVGGHADDAVVECGVPLAFETPDDRLGSAVVHRDEIGGRLEDKGAFILNLGHGIHKIVHDARDAKAVNGMANADQVVHLGVELGFALQHVLHPRAFDPSAVLLERLGEQFSDNLCVSCARKVE